MNMHKSKGKQFHEVIVFEGWPRGRKGDYKTNLDRILKWNDLTSSERDVRQARQMLQVAVTRAKSGLTILTSKDDSCRLIFP